MEASCNIPNSDGITFPVYFNKCDGMFQYHIICDKQGFVLG
jgi:hypothetical protein